MSTQPNQSMGEEQFQAEAVKTRNMLVAAHALQHMLSMALPTLLIFIRADLDFTFTQLGVVAAAARVTGGLMQMPSGWLADRYGTKQLLVVGFALTLGGFLMLSTASTLPAMVLAQVIIGIGNSTFHPASFPAVAAATRHSGLGMGMALHNIGGIVGAATSYSLVAILATWLGWRTALQSMVAVGTLLALYFAFTYVEPRKLMEQAKQEDEQREREEAASREQLEGSAAVRRKWLPVVVIAVAGFLSGSFGSGFQTFLPTFFSESKDSTAVVAGMLSTLMMSGGAVGSFFGGKFADRFDRSTIVVGGSAIAAALVVILVNAPVEALVLAALLLLVGFFRTMTRPPFHAITSSVAPSGMSGSVFGLVFGGSFLGGSLGNPLVGYLADQFSLSLAFTVIAGLFVIHGLLIKLMGLRNMTGVREESQAASG